MSKFQGLEFRRLLFPILGSLLLSPARAGDLSLDAAVAAALADNAQLQSMRATAGAMAERPAQARALPNPMFRYGGMDRAAGGTFPGTDEKRYMIEQTYPWFGKRGLREVVARKDAESMAREVDAMAREVVMMVKEAYFSLRAVQQVTTITRSEEGVLKRMAQSAEASNATGQRSQQDVLKAQSEVTMLQPRLLELAAKEEALKAKLNALLNQPAFAAIGTAVSEPNGAPPPGDTLLDLAEATRPEIQGAQLQLERAESELRLMKKDRNPDYQLGVEYRSFERDDDLVMFTVGLEIPVWRGKNRAQVHEAELMRDARRAALEETRRKVASETWSARAAVAAAHSTLAVYRNDLLPQAQSRFAASEAAYQTGQVDFLDLLESERFLLNARIMTAMAEGDLGMQLARLERAVGKDLP